MWFARKLKEDEVLQRFKKMVNTYEAVYRQRVARIWKLEVEQLDWVFEHRDVTIKNLFSNAQEKEWNKFLVSLLALYTPCDDICRRSVDMFNISSLWEGKGYGKGKESARCESYA